MKYTFTLFLLVFGISLHAENGYFKYWKKEIQPGVFIQKDKGENLKIIHKSDTLYTNSYYIYKSIIYAERNRGTFRVSEDGFVRASKAELDELNKEIIWKRTFYYYHGFPSVLTLILCLPSLFLILLPLTLSIANIIFGKTRKIFAVKFRWFWIVVILLGWALEYWLRNNPQSF